MALKAWLVTGSNEAKLDFFHPCRSGMNTSATVIQQPQPKVLPTVLLIPKGFRWTIDLRTHHKFNDEFIQETQMIHVTEQSSI
jgi:hypothetical protein